MRTTDLEIRRLLNQVNGTPVRVTIARFAGLWDPPMPSQRAMLHMRDLVMHPPAGFVIEEMEGRKLAILIRKDSNAH